MYQQKHCDFFPKVAINTGISSQKLLLTSQKLLFRPFVLFETTAITEVYRFHIFRIRRL